MIGRKTDADQVIVVEVDICGFLRPLEQNLNAGRFLGFVDDQGYFLSVSGF